VSTVIAYELPATLLSLPMYARVMGINPVHFQGADAVNYFPLDNRCTDVWPRHSWQYADAVSHEDLARAIFDAEQEIAAALGYYPAPKWIAQEICQFPRHHRPDVWRQGGWNVRSGRVSVNTKYGKFIQSGQRAITPVLPLGVAVNYTKGVGTFFDTATVTTPTTLTIACEVKVYHAGEGGNPAWEIRPARSKSISLGVFTAVFDAWLLIDPDKQALYPTPSTTQTFAALNISTTVNEYVVTVDVYREHNDFTQPGCVLYWEPQPRAVLSNFCQTCGGDGCPACSHTAQDGCLHVRDVDAGIVVPVPAEYDSTTGQWDQVAFSECRDPDMVKLYYYAGEYSQQSLRGLSCDPLSHYWAQTIAYLATARLERPFCSCGNVQALTTRLREDLAFTGAKGSYQLDFDELQNPFGTHYGEIFAWRRVGKLADRNIGGGAI